MSTLRTKLIAQEITRQLQGTTDGHCARVDFLDRTETLALCQYLINETQGQNIVYRILATHNTASDMKSLFITTDEAIERRNRKQGRLCLFVPSDLIDAAYSSLANSFALIDGRTLHETILKQVMRRLPEQAQKVLRIVSRGSTQASYDQRLDFAITAYEYEQQNKLDQLGLELWRVGLIADARSDFADHLESNRHCTIELSRPSRLSATSRERIQSIKVDTATATALGSFFQGKTMNDVVAWSHELATKENLTFDKWVFPHLDRSNIRGVSVQPFVNSKNIVEKFCKLEQPDGAYGSLKAACSPKRTMVVKWKCEPTQPDNLSSWSIRILPSDNEDELDEDSDYIEPKIPRVPAKRRSATIKLDLEEDELPNCPVCVRIVPLDAAGNEIMNEETGEAIVGLSTEFFLVKDVATAPPATSRESRSVVPTVAYGQLELAMNLSENSLPEPRIQWVDKDITTYFSLSFPGRSTLNIGLSKTLLELEKHIITEARNSGCYFLSTEESLSTPLNDCTPYILHTSKEEHWQPFWKGREAFFSRLKKTSERNVIETADWIPELAGAALRYAQSYRELLTTLLTRGADTIEVLEALAVDTLLVRQSGKGGNQEEALIILPTHPLRVAWYANYTQLLRNWEEQLISYSKGTRKRAVDMLALRLLEPMNVPAFGRHPASNETFLFFQNLRFFHGVALPASVTDPHRRLYELALLLGMDNHQANMSDIRPEQLKEHFSRFQALHPYADTLVTTLVNPDRGTVFAQALQQLLDETASSTEEQEGLPINALQIMAYMQDKQNRVPKALEDVRRQLELQNGQASDYFLPRISTTVRPISQLEHRRPPEAHIAVVTDFSQPRVMYQPLTRDTLSTTTSSYTFYGLMTRFISQFIGDETGLHWFHRIMPESAKKAEHPAGSKYSELLTEVQEAFLQACGYCASQQQNVYPLLEVQLDAGRRDLLEHLHTNTNWVITLDRFFTLDYYDSPHHTGLDTVARKYVLDYSPETIEGLGHRMMVTTAWHEEIETLLAQAMQDLGFARIEQSVSQLLHHLKTVSGRLALQALESPNSAAAAVGLGAVTSWLQKNGRLRKALLLPVDSYPRLFSLEGIGKTTRGERRCDLVLISFRRNILDATFIEVKWRRGQTPLLQELAEDMALQMEGTAQAMRNRFFSDEQRLDGALQRAYLANVLRFYLERARRYQFFDASEEATFLEHLARLEKSGMDFRPVYEGYIISLDSADRKPLLIDTQTEKAKITLLTAQHLEYATALSPLLTFTDEQQELTLTVHEDELPFNEESQDDEAIAEKEQEEGAQTEVLQTLDELSVKQPSSSEVIVPLGETSGIPIEWKPGIAGSPHLFIMGIPGQGKSWTTTRILCELGKQEVPSLVLDFHGQFADPNGPFAQKIHPTTVDASQGLPFSPFECTHENGAAGWKATSYALAEILANVTSMGPMQRDVIYTALQGAYKAAGFGNPDIEATDLHYPTAEEVLKRIKHEEQAGHANNVTARCRPLLEMDLFQPTKQNNDLLTTIRGGLVIDLHNLYAEELQVAAGAFVLHKLYRDMFRWGAAKQIRLAIVLDEAHRLARDVTLPKIMKEGRKFGIAVVVASQGIGDFHPDILANAGTKIIFRTNYPDSKKVANFMRGRQDQDIAPRIEQLSVGSAYVRTPDMTSGSIVHMYPLE